MKKSITLLWALRSQCNLYCKYCYFNSNAVSETLPHSDELVRDADNDLSIEEALTLISTFTPGLVNRVFIGGGEPFLWAHIFDVIHNLRSTGCEVVVCTNGTLLCDGEKLRSITQEQIKALSVSLDSYDELYSNSVRIDPIGKGWRDVVEGIKSAVKQRDRSDPNLKVGIYSVITHRNVNHVSKTAKFVNDLGVDYYIPQLVDLSTNHFMFSEFALTGSDFLHLKEEIDSVMTANLSLILPPIWYLKALSQPSNHGLPQAHFCPCGQDFIFIEQDGSIWPCPSIDRITSLNRKRDIIQCITEYEAFPNNRVNCSYFTKHCLNMQLLIDFDLFIKQRV